MEKETFSKNLLRWGDPKSCWGYEPMRTSGNINICLIKENPTRLWEFFLTWSKIGICHKFLEIDKEVKATESTRNLVDKFLALKC